jgi:hypothetical protein
MPILVGKDRKLPLIDLDEALEAGLHRDYRGVRGWQRAELNVSMRRGGRHHPDGEGLIGAKQNQFVNTTIVVPATASIVPGLVQQRRWNYTSRDFRRADRLPMRACDAKAKHVTPGCDERELSDGPVRIWRDIEGVARWPRRAPAWQ